MKVEKSLSYPIDDIKAILPSEKYFSACVCFGTLGKDQIRETQILILCLDTIITGDISLVNMLNEDY